MYIFDEFNTITMKKIILIMATIIGLVACRKAEEVVPPGEQGISPEEQVPTVSLKILGSTENSISFSVTVEGAENCSYLVYQGADETVSVEDVLADGVSVKGDGSEIVVDGLKSSTAYNVVAAAGNTAGTVMSDVLQIMTRSLYEDVEADIINIVSTESGYWYNNYNYYVILVADNGDRYALDFFTVADTEKMYLPYGDYRLADNEAPYTLGSEYSGCFPKGNVDENAGSVFTDASVTVGVEGGFYKLTFMFAYDVDGVSRTVTGSYNGPMSGASVPEEDRGDDKFLELLDVGVTSFRFRINAGDNQFWRCSVVEKLVYDMQPASPGSWVINYGFLFSGSREIEWKNGEEFIPGFTMNVAANTEYLIFAVLVDSETGYDMQSGVEVLELRTDPMPAGTGVVEVDIKRVGTYDVTFDCRMDEGVSKYSVVVYREETVEEARQTYMNYGMFNSFEEMMYLLISTGSSPRARTFYQSEEITWGELWAHEPHRVCVMVEDVNGGQSLVLSEVFTTLDY